MPPPVAPSIPVGNETGAWNSPDELRGRLLELERAPARSSWIDSYAYDMDRKILYIWFFVVKGMRVRKNVVIDPGRVVDVKGFAYPDTEPFKAIELDSVATNSKGLWAYYQTIMTKQLANYIQLGGGWGQVGTYVPNTQRVHPLVGNEIQPD